MKTAGLFVLSWLIVAFGQPAWSPWLSPLAACIGYALFWRVAANIPLSKKRFWTACAWFAAVQLIQLSWMTSTDFQGFYILFVYLAVALWLGLQFGLTTLFIDKIPMAATAALWTLLEWSRLFVLCGFSWNPVGLSLSTFTFPMQTASLFGVLGLSFLVILTNLAFWKKKHKVAVALAVFPYLFGWLHTTLHHSNIEQSPTMTVGLVQTGLLPSQKIPIEGRFKEFIPPTQQWHRIVNLLKTRAHPLGQPLDLVVLPEFSVPNSGSYPASAFHEVFDKQILSIEEKIQASNQFWVQAIGKIFKTDVIAGLEAEESGLHFTSAFYCKHQEPHLQRYDKQILVPLAEYVPFEWVKTLTRAYGITEFFTHGKEAKVFPAKIPLSASICYEETFSHLMRKSRQKGASMFVNLTNDNWYPNSKLPQQHFDHARLRAVENGVPMVRACNTGVTAAVDSLGRVIGQITEETRADVLIAKVPLYHYPTLYSLWGDWGIVSLSVVFILICFWMGGFRRVLR
ncbi:MAG TPA: apolipoprotein N-acyltransferase [Rhabdochlamydiaceae bacterium]|nr:apolipoprotein N-acyltransferase [Rhabdochlamydiaceae bacterium]